MTQHENPAQAAIPSDVSGRVQRDSLLSREVKREGVLRELDQALMDLRHARHAMDGAQNPSDKQYASAVVDAYVRHVAKLRSEERNLRR